MKDVNIIVQKKKLSEMTDEEINISKYRSLEKRYNSLVEACDKLEEQNNMFRAELEMGYQKLENAQKNVEINKMIVQNALSEKNSREQSFLGEIADLKAKIKAM